MKKAFDNRQITRDLVDESVKKIANLLEFYDSLKKRLDLGAIFFEKQAHKFFISIFAK
jgi:hypothetical protein